MRTKQFVTAEVKAIEDDEPNGSFEVILSALSVDRDNEAFGEKAFDPLPDHINFDINHSMKAQDIVGSGVPSYGDDGNLHVKGTWASTPLAQEIRSLVTEGHLRTTSVTFGSPKKATKAGGPTTITSAELLNGSFVVVPANKDALVLSAKAGARNSAADQEHIQSAHDHMVSAGADCAATKGLKAAGMKSIVGSVEALQDRVNDALEDAYGDKYGYWGYLRGVIPSGGGGYCVFQSSCMGDGYDSATYRQDFTDDGAVVTLVGDPSEVDVHEIVVPDADADREGGIGMLSIQSASSAKDATGAGDDVLDTLRLDLEHLRLMAGLDT